MKLIFLLLSFLNFSTVNPAPPSTTTLEVRISGVQKTVGSIEVSLFNKEKKWLRKGKAYTKKRVEVTGSEVVVVFENLPQGDYALVSYHDVNNNNRVDKTFIGLPKEPYAMTRKAKSRFRKPYYKEMKFACNKDYVVIETRLKVIKK